MARLFVRILFGPGDLMLGDRMAVMWRPVAGEGLLSIDPSFFPALTSKYLGP